MKYIPYFERMLMKSVYKFHKKDSDIAIEIKELYDYYYENNKKLKSFLLKFLSEYDIACVIFYEFCISLYAKFGIFSMYGKTYVKYLTIDCTNHKPSV